MQAIRNSGDIELTADEVEVGGIVSYIDDEQFSIIADQITLELIPIEGLVLNSVTPEKILVDGNWIGNWTAQVEPGNWIFRATHEEQNLVTMGLVEAEVVTGSFEEFELTVGGWFNLETEWLDYNGTQHTLADVDVEGADIVNQPELILNIGMGMRWVAPVNEDGTLEMLMIPGTIEAESEFEVIQRNLTMTYTGGQGISVSPGQESPAAVLSHVRIAKHEISIITLNSSGSDPEFEGDVEDVMFILDTEGGYQPVEFVLSVVLSLIHI